MDKVLTIFFVVLGVFAVCSARDNPWVAYPADEKGTVTLFSPKTGDLFTVKVRVFCVCVGDPSLNVSYRLPQRMWRL